MSGEGDTKKDNGKNWIVFVLFSLFFSYVYRFLVTDGNNHPLVDMLFKMILILSILVFFFTKPKLKKEKMK